MVVFHLYNTVAERNCTLYTNGITLPILQELSPIRIPVKSKTFIPHMQNEKEFRISSKQCFKR